MPKFAVYYIPPGKSPFYKFGSSVLGYDIRNRKEVPRPAALKNFPGFGEEWQTQARPYGFHLTIGDSIDFKAGKMAAIERETEDLLRCFRPDSIFTLRRLSKNDIGFRDTAVVVNYEPNDNMKILHTLIAARLHPMGTGSGYLERFLKNPGLLKKPHHIQRTLKFFSHTVFDSYSPHFTLLNPFGGAEKDRLKIISFFKIQSRGFQEKIRLASLCLCLQMRQEKEWIIHREFPL
ncbi:hypothetical protein JW906_14790 [bacterium]|nr:hypothetical protein [bacterium]